MCEESASFDWSTSDLASAVRDLDELAGKIQRLVDGSDSMIPEGFADSQDQANGIPLDC